MDILLIKKFLKKQCNEEELQKIYIWLNDPNNTEEVTALLKNSWHQVSDKKPDADVDLEKLRNQILDKLHLQEDCPPDLVTTPETYPVGDLNVKTTRTKIPKPRHRFSWLRVAVIIILLEGVAFFSYKYFGSPTKVTEYTEKTTLEGQKYTLYLKDGSKAILNSGSSLKYSNDFGKTGRDLVLEGEAFFEVAEDETKPFRVVANGITTVALGTSFNIKAHKDANTLSVSLITGIVEVSGKNGVNNKYVLTPGEELIFDKKAKKFNKSLFNLKERVSWKDGIIYFHDKDLFEAIEVLEKWYGVEFEVLNAEKAVKDYGKISGEFKNESLTNVLKVMSFAKGFKYDITGKKVVIEL